MKYQPSLDGVRALSVLIVMSYHFDLNTWGHLGVTIFFVLSGYLITAILVGQRQQELGSYLSVFYQRRALRIVPVYYAYVALLGVAFLLFGRPLGFETNWPYLISYTTNFAPIDPNWFTSAFYGHLWSLSLEAQFYLVWPFLIYFLSAKGSKLLMAVLLLACPLIRVTANWLLSSVAPAVDAIGSAPSVLAVEVLDGLPFSYWDAFAAGALIHIAGMRSRSRRFWGWYIGVLLVATLGFGMFLLSSRGGDFGVGRLLTAVLHDRLLGYSIRNFWIVAFLVGALEWKPLRSLFSIPALVLVGRVSYGMYLFHWPILVPIRRLLSYEPHSAMGIVVFLAYAAAVFMAAYISYRWFESWFLRRKHPYGLRKGSENSV